MSERFGLPVGIENDANAATYAEFHFGAAREADTMVMLTLGTGCGGGAVLNGQLYRGWAEFGHMVIVYDGLPCQGTCTGRGHLEPYVTGLRREARAGGVGPAVDAHRLVRLADEGEPRAIEILDGHRSAPRRRHRDAGEHFQPGARGDRRRLRRSGRLRARPGARDRCARSAAGAGKRIRIVRAELGTAAGLIGAGLVAFDALG